VIACLAAEGVTAGASQDDWVTRLMCPAETRTVRLDGPVSMARPGVELTASRSVTTLRAAPVVVGSSIIYPAGPTGKLLAIHADSGCVQWVHDSPTPLRSSVSLGELGDSARLALFFGDARGQVHAVDPISGRGIWVADGRADPGVGSITGSVVVHQGRVIVPISASGVSAAANPEHECCAGRGAVTMLDSATGERLWTYVTMEPSIYTGELSSAGVRLRGPSGAPIWSTPSVDVGRGRIYVTTGQNTSLPATGTSDAIIALDFETGEELWIFQGTPNDVWNMSCTGQPGPNCPSPEHSILRDWDFGGSAVLARRADGTDVLLAGQKSGHLWALDPDTGTLSWQQRVGQGGSLGGNHWGIAISEDRVFMPISDPFSSSARMPGAYAFDIATGEPLWGYTLESACSGDRQERVPQCTTRSGVSATPLVVDGAVVTGALDGRIHIFDGESGDILFRYDTARPFTGIDGVEGHGGSIDAHSVAAGAGLIIIGSGYGSFSQRPGNVLLALRPRR